jgi:hypothetical protein
MFIQYTDRLRRPRPAQLALSLLVLSQGLAHADDAPTTEDWNAKFQATYVRQLKRAFTSPYEGPNSLVGAREFSYSFTATAALGWRPWSGGELYFDPEAAQGVPLSNLTGLGGFTNGELARTSGPKLTIYRARLFWRQTLGFGGGRDAVDSDANQLAGSVDSRRFVWTFGNLSALDIFDDNRYAHDPRTQFMNWALMTHGAWDYPADARGYSWGMVGEWYSGPDAGGWVLRAGRFLQPKEPNGQKLDKSIGQHYGDQVELERPHQLFGQDGKLRLLAFRNRALMSRYADALADGITRNTPPDLNAVRSGNHLKYGLGINLEQGLSPTLGLFARAAWADGRTETYAFTEIDRSLSAGLVSQGTAWGRPNDTLGAAVALSGLSAAHRRYLEVGGIGFFLGDGRLNYRPETVAEVFYNWAVYGSTLLTVDAQSIRNPGYNSDRGPVQVLSLRLHSDF